MNKSLNAGLSHLHKKAIALHAAHMTCGFLTHQRFRRSGLDHGQQIPLKLQHLTPPAVEPLNQALTHDIGEFFFLRACEQGPLEIISTATSTQIEPLLLTDIGTVLTVAQQHLDDLLVGQLGVAQ